MASRKARACSCEDGREVSNEGAGAGIEFRSLETEQGIAAGFTFPLRNFKRAASLKNDQAEFGCQAQNPFCPAFAANAIRRFDELPKPQCPLFLLGLHPLKISRGNVPTLLGISPMPHMSIFLG
jgi:hypothetical protein